MIRKTQNPHKVGKVNCTLKIDWLCINFIYYLAVSSSNTCSFFDHNIALILYIDLNTTLQNMIND